MCEKITSPVDVSSPVNVTDGELICLLVDNIHDYAIFATDPNGLVLNWNVGSERLLGYSEGEIIGQPVDRFFTREDIESGVPRREMVKALETGRGEDERWHVRKDGSRFWSCGTISPLLDEEQKILGFANIMRDRSEQKHMADALKEALATAEKLEHDRWAVETRFTSLVKHVKDHTIFTMDVGGRITSWNESAERTLGYSESEILGQPFSIIFTPEDIQGGAPEREIRIAKEAGQADNICWQLRKGGERFWAVGIVTPMRDADGKLVGYSKILRDMTEQKRMEEELQRAHDGVEAKVREQTAELRTANDELQAATVAQKLQGELLRKNQEQFAELTTHLHQCLWTFDVVKDRFLYVSPGYEKIWGRSCQICLDDPGTFMDVIHSLNRELLTREGDDMNSTGSIDVERSVVRPDGSERRVWIRGYPITSEGHTLRLVGIVEDITEKWKLVQERDTLLSRLEIHIERMPLAYVLTGPDVRVLAWNPAAEKIFGFTAAEVLGQHPFDVIVSPISQAAADENIARLQTGDMDAHGEYENLTKDGRTITCEWYNTPILGEQGEFLGCISLAQDITLRREAEKKLQLRDRAIQAVSQGILITDPNQPDDPIIYASPGFERMTGYSAEEVLGKNCRFLQGKDTAPEANAVLREAFREGLECSVEILNYRKDGTEFWNALFITPVRDKDHRLAYFVGVHADVTDRRVLEQAFHQSQRMEAIGQLAGGVAHDFNNLLTIISGHSEILLSTLESKDPLRESAKAISDAGELAASLTRQLLAFSRQAVLETRVLNLNELVLETEKMLRRLIGEDILLTAVLDPQISCVKVDPHQLDQVLMNLSINARDAMPRGGRLTLQTKNVTFEEDHADVPAGRYVMLAVSDSGGGMTPEVKPRIFEPFFTTKDLGKGTGLGLAVVHGIVTQSGGHIGFSSELDHGTTFKLYFPAVEETPTVAKPVPVLSDVRGNETVLLVEDEDSVRGLAQLVLKSRGYIVLAAGDGLEALRTIEQYQGEIDLLFTDVVMPGMGGIELAETLRPRFPQMRVLFSSGYTDNSVLRHGILEKEVAFLQKPYTAQTLTVKVRQLLDHA